VARIEWLRLCPNAGPLAQMWQTLDMRPRSIGTGAAGASSGPLTAL
jgi:hypothetical protein